MGDNFETLMTSYFEDIKKSMKARMRIPVSLVEQHLNDICFLVDIDYTYVQAAIPRVRWLRPLGYEINVDETSAAITTLLAEEVDKIAKIFGTYDVMMSKIEMELKTASTLKKKDKLVRKLKKRFGESVDVEEEEEEEDDEEEEQQPLALTQGLGEDEEEKEGVEGEEVKKAPTQAEPKKRKAKTQPAVKTKKVAKLTPAKPTTPATRATTRASTLKAKEKVKQKKMATK